MREEALKVERVKRFLATTDSDHDEPLFPNLAGNLRPAGPNQLWVADITYIRLRSEFVFLAVILEAWSRKVVGYAVSKLLDTRLPLTALDAAIASRCPAPGVIQHSDRGCQYASRQYRERLAQAGMQGSMSRRASPYDNAQGRKLHEDAEARGGLGPQLRNDAGCRGPHSAVHRRDLQPPALALGAWLSNTRRVREHAYRMRRVGQSRTVTLSHPRASLQRMCNFRPPLTLPRKLMNGTNPSGQRNVLENTFRERTLV